MMKQGPDLVVCISLCWIQSAQLQQLAITLKRRMQQVELLFIPD